MSPSVKSTVRVVLLSAATGSGARLIGAVAGLITLPLLMAHLGKVQFGVWVLMAQTVQLLHLSDLGVSNAVGRIVARYRGEDDLPGVGSSVASAVRLLAGGGLVVVVMTLVLSRFVPALVRIPSELHSVAADVFIITGLALGLSLPLSAATGVITGYQRYPVLDSTRVLGSTLTLAGIVGAGAAGFLTLRVAAAIFAIALLVPLAVQVVIARKMLAGDASVMSPPRSGAARELLGLGSSTMMVTASAMGYRQGVAILLGVFGGTAAAGVYGAVLSILTHITALLTQLPRSLMTIASEIQARARLSDLRNLNRLVVQLSVVLGVFLLVGATLYAKAGLELLFGGSDWTLRDFEQASVAVIIMAVGLAIGLPQIAARSILQGTGLHWDVAVRFALASLLSVVFGAVVLWAGAGVVGAGAAWALVYVLQGVWLYPYLICRTVDDTPLGLLRHGYLPGIVTAGLAALPLVAIKLLLPLDGWAEVLGGLALGIGGVALAFIYMIYMIPPGDV